MKVKISSIPNDYTHLAIGKEYEVECVDITDDKGILQVLVPGIWDWHIVSEQQFTQAQAQAMYDALVEIDDMRGNANYSQSDVEEDLSRALEIAENLLNKLDGTSE